MKCNLRDETDYVLMPDSDWKLLQSLELVDASQDILRYSVSIGRETVVSLRKLYVERGFFPFCTTIRSPFSGRKFRQAMHSPFANHAG